MPQAPGKQFGEFQAVRELNQVGACTIYSARKGDAGEASFAIKVLRVPDFLSPEETRHRINTFLAQANAQQRIGQRIQANKRSPWAPIHGQPACTQEIAYYVTDLYPRSTDALVDGRRGSVTSVELWSICRQLCQALKDLQASANRGHGNLKPGNLLLKGRGAKLDLFLSDPLDDQALAAGSDNAADLKAFGGILYQLVMHALPPANFSGELPDKPQWHALGPQGTSWRALCGRLLSADHDKLTLDQVSRDLGSLTPRTSGWIKKAIAAAVIFMVLAGAALAWTSSQGKSATADLNELNRQWQSLNLGQLQGTNQQKAETLTRYRSFAEQADAQKLDAIVSAMSRLRPPEAMAGFGPWHLGARKQIDRERAAIDEVQIKIRELVDTRLKDKSINLDDPVPLVVQLPLRLGWHDLGARARQMLEALDQAKSKLPVRDPFLEAVSILFHRDLGAPPDFGFNPADVKDRLLRFEAFNAAAPRLVGFLAGDFDFKSISQEVSPAFAGSTDQSLVASLQKWLDAVQSYAILKPDPRHPERWQPRFSSLASHITLLEDSPNQTEYSRRLNDLQTNVTTWLTGPARLRDRETISTQGASYNAELEKLNLDIQKELTNPQTLRKALSTDSKKIRIERLQHFLRGSGDDLIDRIAQGSDPSAARAQLDALTLMVLECSVKLDRDKDEQRALFVNTSQVPLTTDADRWLKMLNDWAPRQRDALLGRLLPDVSPGNDLSKKTLDQISEQWSAWRDDTQSLVDQMVNIQAPLGPAGGFYTPAEPVAGRASVVSQLSQWSEHFNKWKTGLSGPPAKLSVDPLASITVPSDADLLDSSNAAEGGLLLAAWQKVPDALSHGKLAPWTISQDLSAWRKLRDWIALIPNLDRRGALQVKLASQLVEHFKAWSDHPGGELSSPADIPSIQFDCALYNLIRLNASNPPTNEAVLGKALNGLIAAAGAANQPDFMRRLAAARDDQTADPQATPAWGPKKLGWTLGLVGAQGRVRFTSPDESKSVIDFAPIESAGGKGAYLSTTEVSTGLFLKLYLANRNGVGNLPGSSKPPKAWENRGDTVVKAPQWFKGMHPTALDVLRDSLKGESAAPSPDSPVTYISPNIVADWVQAFNCRLPTSAEWLAALADEQKAGNLARSPWVMRGKEWAGFVARLKNRLNTADGATREQLAAADPSTWMWFEKDDLKNQHVESVWNDTLTGPANPGAAAFGQTSLMFQPEPDPGQSNPSTPGHRFYHLVGNAAEMVTAPEGGSPAFVIGGSAFSPPEMKYDQPIALPSMDGAWCDVGFRLALSAPIKPLRDRLAKALQDPPFIEAR